MHVCVPSYVAVQAHVVVPRASSLTLTIDPMTPMLDLALHQCLRASIPLPTDVGSWTPSVK